jgi:hypothetical protein
MWSLGLLRFSVEMFPAKTLNTRSKYTLELGGLRYFSAMLKIFGYIFCWKPTRYMDMLLTVEREEREMCCVGNTYFSFLDVLSAVPPFILHA